MSLQLLTAVGDSDFVNYRGYTKALEYDGVNQYACISGASWAPLDLNQNFYMLFAFNGIDYTPAGPTRRLFSQEELIGPNNKGLLMAINATGQILIFYRSLANRTALLTTTSVDRAMLAGKENIVQYWHQAGTSLTNDIIVINGRKANFTRSSNLVPGDTVATAMGCCVGNVSDGTPAPFYGTIAKAQIASSGGSDNATLRNDFNRGWMASADLLDVNFNKANGVLPTDDSGNSYPFTTGIATTYIDFI